MGTRLQGCESEGPVVTHTGCCFSLWRRNHENPKPSLGSFARFLLGLQRRAFPRSLRESRNLASPQAPCPCPGGPAPQPGSSRAGHTQRPATSLARASCVPGQPCSPAHPGEPAPLPAPLLRSGRCAISGNGLECSAGAPLPIPTPGRPGLHAACPLPTRPPVSRPVSDRAAARCAQPPGLWPGDRVLGGRCVNHPFCCSAPSLLIPNLLEREPLPGDGGAPLLPAGGLPGVAAEPGMIFPDVVGADPEPPRDFFSALPPPLGLWPETPARGGGGGGVSFVGAHSPRAWTRVTHALGAR